MTDRDSGSLQRASVRVVFSRRAVDHYGEEIDMNNIVLPPERRIRVAVCAIAAWVEYSLSFIEQTRLEVELGVRRQSLGVLIEMQRAQAATALAKMALARVGEGDYSGVKEFFKREGEMRVEEKDDATGRRWMFLGEIIPEHGEPIGLPEPAYLDPRFNGEGASQ